MNFEFNSEKGVTQVSSELTDKCLLCNTFDDCPLIQALTINLVYPSADRLHIEECPMFKMVDISE